MTKHPKEAEIENKAEQKNTETKAKKTQCKHKNKQHKSYFIAGSKKRKGAKIIKAKAFKVKNMRNND